MHLDNRVPAIFDYCTVFAVCAFKYECLKYLAKFLLFVHLDNSVSAIFDYVFVVCVFRQQCICNI